MYVLCAFYVMGELALSVVDTIHPKRNKFAMGPVLRSRQTGESNLNDSSANNILMSFV